MRMWKATNASHIRTASTTTARYTRRQNKPGKLQPSMDENPGAGQFRVVSGAHVERLTVHDPYCGSHIGKLVSFLAVVKGMVNDLEWLEIRCRELSLNDRKYQPPALMKAQLEEAVTKFANKKQEIAIASQFQNRQSHDRWLQFRVVEGTAGTSSIHRFDLTGGIDYLMDPRAATTVYRYEVGS